MTIKESFATLREGDQLNAQNCVRFRRSSANEYGTKMDKIISCNRLVLLSIFGLPVFFLKSKFSYFEPTSGSSEAATEGVL